jgi:hypothetical protein
MIPFGVSFPYGDTFGRRFCIESSERSAHNMRPSVRIVNAYKERHDTTEEREDPGR